MKNYRVTSGLTRVYDINDKIFETFRLLSEEGIPVATYIRVIEDGEIVLIEDEDWMHDMLNQGNSELDEVIEDLKFIGWI
jgi:hypothetical protein